ncbi:hypothetical protein [Microcoleus sp. B13-B6]|uniref:hypothetical protein n=1 Tax=Microcoleus sp. B13-B6 TaxID=2818652 RepID=UPI002FD44445
MAGILDAFGQEFEVTARHGSNGYTDSCFYQCPMPNAQCPMPNAQFPIPNAQCPIPNSQIIKCSALFLDE